MISRHQSKKPGRESLLASYSDRMGSAVLRHRTNVALAAARIDAEAASYAKTEFIAKMSHELRTPLNAIIGFAEVIAKEERQSGDNNTIEYVKYIETSAQHLLSVVNNILELSKIQCGGVVLHKEPVDFGELLETCVVLFKETVESENLELLCDVSLTLPLVEADITKLRQIIINLLSNAVKFTPAGGRINVNADLDADNYLHVVVKDSGIGMTPEQLEVAMQPFGQADIGMDRRFEGSGLGLPIVHALTELHGGKLHIHSKPGEGTVVSLRIPAKKRSAGKETRQSALPHASPSLEPEITEQDAEHTGALM